MPRKETPLQKYLRELRIKRYNAVVTTIPIVIPAELRAEYKRYALVATQNLGKRGLARVVWPWLAEPQPERVKRGDPRRNPTAIK